MKTSPLYIFPLLLSRIKTTLKLVLVGIVVAIGIGATSSQASAQQVGRPTISGWHYYFEFESILFKDLNEYGKKFCRFLARSADGASPYEFDHFVTPWMGIYTNEAAIYCHSVSNPAILNEPPLLVSYVQACANAKSSAVTGVTVNLTCTADDPKPPICDCASNGDPEKGKPKNSFGDPIDMTASETTLTEDDYTSSGGLNFSRFYSSVKRAGTSDGMFQGWRHSYSKRLNSTIWPNYHPPLRYDWKQDIPGWGASGEPGADGKQFATISRPSGYSHSFMSVDGGKTWGADSDVNYRLRSTQFDSTGSVTEWQLTTPDSKVETYDQLGRLASIRSRSGQLLTLSYSAADLLTAVTDDFGRTLQFQYDEKGRLARMIDPGGQPFDYTYDAANNMIGVIYPDGAGRQYLYAEAAFDAAAANPALAHLLTGTVDVSNGKAVRHVTINYDAQGRPVSTQLPYGVNKFTLDYNASAVTDPLGVARNISYTRINGLAVPTGTTQPAGAGSAAASMIIGHDANGNVSYRDDFNHNRTSFTYDLARNLEIARVEGYAFPLRTISTQWHPTFRVPTIVAEPRKRTTYAYDASGNLMTKTEQATTDATGAAAFTATLTGTPRISRYTYNSLGNVLTATGPRNDTTTYSYDAQNNIASVTNAAGHQTTVSNYDVNGRPGTITDPNGLVTTLTYSPRGWLASRNVGGETTNYIYDGIGQLTQVNQPGGATINYTYDDARRLIGMSDNFGNSISYMLDPMGNRTSEQVRDPNGALSRQTTRVYDALNRLQQITGAQQ